MRRTSKPTKTYKRSATKRSRKSRSFRSTSQTPFPISQTPFTDRVTVVGRGPLRIIPNYEKQLKSDEIDVYNANYYQQSAYSTWRLVKTAPGVSYLAFNDGNYNFTIHNDTRLSGDKETEMVAVMTTESGEKHLIFQTNHEGTVLSKLR